MRQVGPGEVLIEAGDLIVPFLVVKAGRVEVVQSPGPAETIVAAHGPGQFSGEVNMLSDRRALFQARATEAGEVVELDHDSLLGLVQTDTELSEIILRAFILRRVELITQGIGDIVLVGPAIAPGPCHRKVRLAPAPGS